VEASGQLPIQDPQRNGTGLSTSSAAAVRSIRSFASRKSDSFLAIRRMRWSTRGVSRAGRR